LKKCIIVYAGQYYDAETGLHYNYHRYYDPILGRYLRADPIGLAGGINPYTYVQNNPVNFIDPYGLDWSSGAALSVSKVAAGGGVYGINSQSFSNGRQEVWHDYSGMGDGLDLGASFESVWAWGSGSWEGKFRSVNASIAFFSGSVFWTPGEDGWVGFSFGFSLGLPGIAYEETCYEETKPRQKTKTSKRYKVPKPPVVVNKPH